VGVKKYEVPAGGDSCSLPVDVHLPWLLLRDRHTMAALDVKPWRVQDHVDQSRVYERTQCLGVRLVW
jgi:hypothetical protein